MNSITWLDDSNTVVIIGGGRRRKKGKDKDGDSNTQNVTQTITVGDDNSGNFSQSAANTINYGKIKIQIVPPILYS